MNNEAFNVIAEEQDLAKSLSGDEILIENLSIFESRAIQKLQDYASYVEIISNPEYDDTFKEQALSMANGLFLKGTIVDPAITSNQQPQKISGFLTRLLRNDFGEVKLKIKDVTVIQHFQHLNNDTYQCLLSFTQKIGRNKTKKTITVVLTKIEKEFGTDSKMVWMVFLQEIDEPAIQ